MRRTTPGASFARVAPPFKPFASEAALTQMMRIALVVPGGVDRSGEYRVIPALLALIARLSALHEVHVFALSQEAGRGEWNLAGARIHNVGTRHTRLRTLRLICARHRSSRFDVVQAIWSGACGEIAVAAATLLRIPSAVHVAGGELVALRDLGYGGALNWRGRLREALVLRRASAVTAASAPILRLLADLRIPAQRLALGVDLGMWPPRLPLRRARGVPARLIQVASLNRVKDQPTLLRALASVAAAGFNFQMDIVGDDTLQGEIQALAQRLGLSHRVNFRGFMTQRQLRPLVQAADLMIVSSRHEAGPLVLLEAAAVGVPTVGTAVGHVAEWAPDASVAVPVGDPDALADAIMRLLADEDLRLGIARSALERATREDADYTAGRFQALYLSLSGRTG
ncbi:MAG TPA: glycosyltransferase family 4 protein [Steroidobacteraceae bacterium]|jgi:glycosyltransferase involved in cell wall biosynthesis|nr:glycosyltransferase family 4 protein [Steroidobacteraceae bacterium]